MAEADREAEAAKQKEEEYRKHIEECEAMGYDMSEYKNPEAIGGASEEEVKAARAAAEAASADAEKAGIRSGQGLKGKWAAQTENGGQYMGDCTHDCKHCSRRNCPNRVEPL